MSASMHDAALALSARLLVGHPFVVLAYVLGGVALLAMWLDALHQVFHGWSGHGL